MPGGNTYNTTNETETSQDNSLPDWAAPYFERNIARAEAAYGTEYDPYRGDRIAGDNADINASRDMARGIAGQSLAGIDDARQFATDGMARATDLGNYDPSSFTETEFDPNQFSNAQFDSNGFSQAEFDPNQFSNAQFDDNRFSNAQFDDNRFSNAQFDDNRFSQAEFDPNRFSDAQFGSAGKFDSDAAAQYMSPYQQNVTDVNKAAAFQDFQRMQGSRDAAAVNAGAFGGSRQGVVQGMAEQDLMDNLAQIQAQGSQGAFENAQGQFAADRDASFSVDQARAQDLGRVQAGQFSVDQERAGDLGRVQAGQFSVDQERAGDLGRVQAGQFSVDQERAGDLGRVQSGQFSVDQERAGDLGRVQSGQFDVNRASADDLGRVQAGQFDVNRAAADDLGRVQAGQFDVNRAAADERGRVDAGRAGENQFGAQQGLAGLSAGSELAAGLVDIGSRERQNDMANAQLIEGIGLAEQSEEQRQMDLDYQNFIEERDFMQNQVGGMTNILNGQPIAPTGSMTGTSNSVGTTPGPSPFQQIAGGGIAGIGLYNGGMG